MARRKQVWNELHKKMSNKRTRNEGYSKKGSTSAPHEIIVQRLSSEPNNKQTYHPVQPREFLSFNYSDLTLINLKKACADHFNVPMGSVDVLVSNKGPSATVIDKAECLVHYSYDSSKKKLMLLDIQGSHYNLYDPEIATEELMCSESSEIYFCCGNLSTMSINFFKETHICNKYCKMMNLRSPI